MFSSDADVPAGYITMTAGDILRGAQALVDDRRAKEKEWNEALPERLAAWADSLSWLERIYHWIPRKKERLVSWWASFPSWNRPDISNLPGRPHTPYYAEEWVDRVRHLSPETKVFINVDHGAVFTNWGAPSKRDEEPKQ